MSELDLLPDVTVQRCPKCACEDFLEICSEAEFEPDCPVNVLQCENCGEQYRTERATWLDYLPTLEEARRLRDAKS